VRTEVAPESLVPAVRRALADVEPDTSAHRIQTMEEVVNRSVAGTRYLSRLLLIFSVVALVLAVIGVHGVMSKLVSQRTHELGVRVALGAEPGSVLRLVLAQGVRLTAIGIGCGLLMSLGLGRILRRFVIGISATDAASYTIAVGAIFVVAMVATMLPAWRAARLDPLDALREDS